MKFQGWLWISLLVLLSGCAASGDLSRQMAGWQSQHVSNALDVWGEPDGEAALGGQTVLTWYDRAAVPSAYTDFGASSVVICERMLAVAEDGTITGWRWRGDRCDSVSPSMRQRSLTAAR